MEIRENAGYKIIAAIRTGKHEEIVIGQHPTAPAQFVCWDCRNGNDYDNGVYTMNYRQALYAMAERIQKNYDYLPVEWKED